MTSTAGKRSEILLDDLPLKQQRPQGTLSRQDANETKSEIRISKEAPRTETNRKTQMSITKSETSLFGTL